MEDKSLARHILDVLIWAPIGFICGVAVVSTAIVTMHVLADIGRLLGLVP